MENLLEQLRSKHSALKSSSSSDSWNEFAKQIRMAALERKQYRDTAVIHESLERLQDCITATSLSQLLERISSACQKLGLKYSVQGNQVYISADHFYVELQCDHAPNIKTIRDVRVAHHSSQPASVSAMAQALRQNSVPLFVDHIKGFMDMYNVTGDQSIKTKFFIVLQSLETDVDKINKCQMQSKNISVGGHLHKTPLGLVQPRSGGLPTKLTFFITPFDLLDEKSNSQFPMTIEGIKSNDLGMSATIGIEQHPQNHQLQTIPLMNYARAADNRLIPSFVPSTNVNSVMMPAAFVLRLKKPIALSEQIIQQIEKLQGACSFSKHIKLEPMLDAIVKSSGLTMPDGAQQFSVALPGQLQNYFICRLESHGEPLKGGLVSKIPFSHPTGIPQIISLLRQQLMVNSMILSCIRSELSSPEGETQSINVELKLVTNQILTTSFRHPFHNSIVTVDFDISDLNSPKCSIHCNAGDVCSNLHASKVIQRCYSIPITIRAILRQAGYEEENIMPPVKKVKYDQGEMIQKIVDIYSSRGHYMLYGSVNTGCSSSSYTKNIQSNQYPLCLRRFSGYKRQSSAHFKPSNSIYLHSSTKSSSIASHKTTTGLQPVPVPAQATDKSRLVNTPMLASLLDDGEHSTLSVHPLGGLPSQTESPMQQAPILTDLLEGSEGQIGADKKTKKTSKKRTNSESLLSPQPFPLQSNVAKKRKKSGSDDLTNAQIQAESMEHVSQDSTDSQTPSKGQITPTTPNSTFSKPAYPRVSTSNESHLVKLLHGDNTLRNKSNKIDLSSTDISDSGKSKTESSNVHSDQNAESNAKNTKRKSVDGRTKTKALSVDVLIKEKKVKRPDTVDFKSKESKSVDVPISPGKKPTKLIIKSKQQPKTPVNSVHKVSGVPPLTIKTAEGRLSPKDKLKKPFDKEKKKKVPKSPGSADVSTPQKPQVAEYFMGFYGARNLKDLPKIPKKKSGDVQESPTSPLPPGPPGQLHKSPVRKLSASAEWQRNKPAPVNQDEPQTQKRTLFAADSFSRKSALLPTPPISSSGQTSTANPQLHKRNSLDAVIHRLNSSIPEDSMSSKPKHDSHEGINSPDDKSYDLVTQPVAIPVTPSEPEDPASPVHEVVVQEQPKAIPLDSTQKQPNSSSNSALHDISSRPILVKQRPVSRPLTFASPPNAMGDRLEDDLMDVALGCN